VAEPPARRGAQALGRGILKAAPWLMKAAVGAGTAAMFLVGGGILVHGIGPLHHAIEALVQPMGSAAQLLLPVLADGLVGVVAGALVLAGVTLFSKLRGG
jgi:predicted DNA repair protein MutK